MSNIFQKNTNLLSIESASFFLFLIIFSMSNIFLKNTNLPSIAPASFF